MTLFVVPEEPEPEDETQEDELVDPDAIGDAVVVVEEAIRGAFDALEVIWEEMAVSEQQAMCETPVEDIIEDLDLRDHPEFDLPAGQLQALIKVFLIAKLCSVG